MIQLIGSQRWRDRRDSYRPADDERFDPRHHAVVLASGDNDVRPFVERHHYSGSLPNSSSYRYLLIDTHRPAWAGHDGVVGVATFGQPGGPSVLSSSFPFLSVPSQEAVELQRLVLLDQVRKNGESWFVSQCMGRAPDRGWGRKTPKSHSDSLERQGVEAVVSFSDPVPRWESDGTLTMPGHVGCVYQALSAWYTGRSKRESFWILSCGAPISRRDLTKVRASCACCGSGKSTGGADGAIERLVAWGASRPQGCRRAWLKCTLPQIARRCSHPGKHRYLWGIVGAARSGLRQLHEGDPDASVYPKAVDR